MHCYAVPTVFSPWAQERGERRGGRFRVLKKVAVVALVA